VNGSPLRTAVVELRHQHLMGSTSTMSVPVCAHAGTALITRATNTRLLICI
jgi:hypothetical protein